MVEVESETKGDGEDDVERNLPRSRSSSPIHLSHRRITMWLPTSSARSLVSATSRLSLSCRSCRTFTTTRAALNSSADKANSSKDPNHPNLWYHTLPDTLPPRIALSFLPTPPQYGSRTVLGYLPANSSAGLRDFKEEPRFL